VKKVTKSISRQAKIDQDLKLLADGVEGSGAEPADEEMVALTKSVRRQMRKSVAAVLLVDRGSLERGSASTF